MAAYSVKVAKTNAAISMKAPTVMRIRKNLAIEANAGLAVPFRRGPTSVATARPKASEAHHRT